MTHDHTDKTTTDDQTRTEQAKTIVEEYVRELRELLRKLRRKMN